MLGEAAASSDGLLLHHRFTCPGRPKDHNQDSLPRRSDETMHKQFRCSSGHHWELSINGPNGATPLPWVVCPQCGSAAETLLPVPASCDDATVPHANGKAKDRPHILGYQVQEELGRGGMGVV